MEVNERFRREEEATGGAFSGGRLDLIGRKSRY
jgi:hypothetical protein